MALAALVTRRCGRRLSPNPGVSSFAVVQASSELLDTMRIINVSTGHRARLLSLMKPALAPPGKGENNCERE